jgi:hypothetical protein
LCCLDALRIVVDRKDLKQQIREPVLGGASHESPIAKDQSLIAKQGNDRASAGIRAGVAGHAGRGRQHSNNRKQE